MTLPFGRGARGRARIHLSKDRHGWVPFEGKSRIVAEVEAEANADGSEVEIRLLTPADHFMPTCLMERVSRALEGQPKGASRYWVREGVTGNKAALEVALDELVRGGWARLEPGSAVGNSKGRYQSVRPYREEDEVPPLSGSIPEIDKRASEPEPPPAPRKGGDGRGGPTGGSPAAPGGGRGAVGGGRGSPSETEAPNG